MKRIVGHAQGLLDGLSDAVAEDGLRLWTAMEAEGEITFASDLKWLAEEGFLS